MKTLPANIDWGKPYHQIAQELNVPWRIVYAEHKRLFHGRKHIRIKPAKDRPKWQKYQSWDWFKRNSELAKEHGCTNEYVRQIRAGLEKAKIPRQITNWNTIDWTNTNRTIASELNCSTGIVQLNRRKLGHPNIQHHSHIHAVMSQLTAEDWRLPRKVMLARLRQIDPRAYDYWIFTWIKKHPELKRGSRWNAQARYGFDWSNLTLKEAAAKAGVSTNTAQAYASSHKKQFKRVGNTGRASDYAHTDWSQTDRAIAQQLGKNIHAVREQRRRKFGNKTKRGI